MPQEASMGGRKSLGETVVTGDENTTKSKPYDVAVPIPCGVAKETYILLANRF
jgi:hypothetical protein